MFLDFFSMREQPFGVTPDPRFLYLGKSHREALASLYYGVETNRGFVALIAPPGLGKTTLTLQLLEKLQRNSRIVFLFQTHCNSHELFHYLLNDLGVDALGMDLVSMHNKLEEILSREMIEGRRFILAIDEAQNLQPEVLETIRMLSNFETSRNKLMQIVLIGQPGLAQKLASPSLEQLQQRISVFAKIEPFDLEEIMLYISHRLQVAGYTGSALFTPAALQIIAQKSRGVPRKINGLCFSALTLACAMGRKRVDAEIMAEVIADLDVESLHWGIPAATVTSTPVRANSVLTSSYSKPKRLSRWTLGLACTTVGVILAAVILVSSPVEVSRLTRAANGAWTAIYGSRTSTEVPAAKLDSESASPTIDEQAIGVAEVEPAPSVEAATGTGTSTIVVQRGDTLRQISLRTLGVYNGDAIEQIQKLNPTITDINHLETGQEIHVPRMSLSTDSAVPETSDTFGKN